MEVIYSPIALEHIKFWKNSGNKKIMKRITELIKAVENHPYEGIGKPEQLKHNFSGCWSRRITKEHRLIYRISANSTIEIISMRFHYF